MANTDNSIDVLLIDGGLVIGLNVPAIPPMQPPVVRFEPVQRATLVRVDE